MTFLVVGGPPVATANAVSLGLPSSGGGLGSSLLSQHFGHADQQNKDLSFRARNRIAGRAAGRQSKVAYKADSVHEEDELASSGSGNSRPGSSGSDSTRTYTRGSSALDRWTPSPAEARARVAVKVVNGMPGMDHAQQRSGKVTLPPLPKLVVPEDDNEHGEDDELQVLSWAKDLPLDVM
ncbi:hypothetical protein BCR44DRAFT_161843 [Catenaria anguillulae PL171]|uniref:Uncharacterized protein n=1 Tax=Catenaria anguillulae PL171 TaxID=765915 RepID=A0A1Y2HZ74_9FUNG|nr:hypothetical protein BCR44DRAFT_161843 [Catenaria anguillulae PL171]